MIRFTTSLLAPAALALMLAGGGGALAESAGPNDTPNPERQSWSFSGPFGTFDKAQLRRGFQIYKDVCGNCHKLSIPFRTLGDPDGPAFSEDEVKKIAASYQVVNDEPNDKGEIFKRPGTPADIFPPPDAFPNDKAAEAQFGKAPPDMWLLAKARKYERGFPGFVFDMFTTYQELGADYIYGILNGYTRPNEDPQWNLHYPSHKIAMPQPLSDGAVTYADGSPNTLQQEAKDVAAFLSWAAEPTLVERKAVGRRVMLFLIVFAVLMYFVKKRVWANVH